MSWLRLRSISRMLKKPASSVLASFRPSTGTRPPHQLGGAHRLGAPYSSHRAPQRVRLDPSLAAALPAERRVLARRGWAGEKAVFLSILQECSPFVPHRWTIDIFVCRNSFSAAC